MKKNRALLVPFVLWAVIFIVVPLVMIVWYGITVEQSIPYTEIVQEDGTTVFELEDGSVVTERPQKKTVISFENFKRMVEPTYLKLLLRSLKIAVITTVICLILGYPVALILTGRDFKRPALWLMLIVLPMWMNFLLRTYAMMTLLERNGVINTVLEALGLPRQNLIGTEAAVLLGMVYNFLPFMILPIYTVMKKMDRRVIEAAEDLGAPPRKVFARVVIPLSLPGVVSGITMVFMPAVTTFAISRLLGNGMIYLIGDAIENYFITFSNRNVGSALSLVLMVLIIISIGLLRKADPKGEGGALW